MKKIILIALAVSIVICGTVSAGMILRGSTSGGGGSGVVSYGSVGTVGNTTGADLVLSPPSTISDGDLLIAVIVDDTDQALTGLGGFTSIASISSSSSRLSTLSKVASSESGSYTFTSGASTRIGAIIRFSKSSGTWNVATSSTAAGTSSVTTGALNTTDGSMLLVVWGNDDNFIIPLETEPADMTSIAVANQGSTLGVGAWYQAYSSAASSVTKYIEASYGDVSAIAIVVKAL